MFKMGNYVEILPKTEIDFMMKRNGVLNKGIVVSVKNDMVEIWRDEIAEMDRQLTTKVPTEQVVLLKDKDDPNMRPAPLIPK